MSTRGVSCAALSVLVVGSDRGLFTAGVQEFTYLSRSDRDRVIRCLAEAGLIECSSRGVCRLTALGAEIADVLPRSEVSKFVGVKRCVTLARVIEAVLGGGVEVGRLRDSETRFLSLLEHAGMVHVSDGVARASERWVNHLRAILRAARCIAGA